jgi:hypothetical protein
MAVQLNVPTVAEIMSFFFEASLQGYAGGGEFVSVGSVVFPEKEFKVRASYKGGYLLYVDRYRVSGEFSSGETVIYLQPLRVGSCVPVWYMSYGGWCAKEKEPIVAHLKAVLWDTYGLGEFCGGRAMNETSEETASRADGLIYENNWGLGSFVRFSGRERIFKEHELFARRREEVFWHDYHGLLLVPSV